MRISDWSSDVCSSDLHVLELVGELDVLGDGHAVLGDARGAERLLQHHVAALRAERHLDGIGQHVDAAQHAVARIDVELHVLGSRSEEHTSELQSLMRISYAVFCLKKKNNTLITTTSSNTTKTINH